MLHLRRCWRSWERTTSTCPDPCAPRTKSVRSIRDVATAALIENWIGQTERRTWFLAETGRNLYEAKDNSLMREDHYHQRETKPPASASDVNMGTGVPSCI